MAVLDLTCESCGGKFSFTTRPAIDTGTEPSMKEMVRSGEAFLGVCPHCGAKSYYDYSFLYKERETNTILYYAASEEDFQEACRLLTGYHAAVPWSSISSWRRRVVTSRGDFAEKLRLLDAGLDDRVVEILKVLAYSSLRQKKPELAVERVQFEERDGTYGFCFYGEGKLYTALGFDKAMYEGVKNRYASQLTAHEREDVLVDRDWALKLLMGK